MILARYLKGVTLSVAAADPTDQHAAWFECNIMILKFEHCMVLHLPCQVWS